MTVWKWITQLKKPFAPEHASFYLYVSVLLLAGFFIVVFFIVFPLSALPTGAMPISHVPRPMFFMSMVFGAFAVLSYRKVTTPLVIFLVVVGLLILAVFNFFFTPIQKVFIYNDEFELTAVVAEGKWKRNYNLGYGVVVIETFCIYPEHTFSSLVDVYERTKIYEQDETSPEQRKQVGIEAIETLRPGQVIGIKYNDLLTDPEINDILFTIYDPRAFDTQYLLGAIEITIHKGEIAPVDSKFRDGTCAILPEK